MSGKESRTSMMDNHEGPGQEGHVGRNSSGGKSQDNGLTQIEYAP